MPSNTLFSAQARKRQHAGELILDGFDNDEIAEVLQCSIRSVSRWRKKLKDNNDDLCTLLRKKEPDSRQGLTTNKNTYSKKSFSKEPLSQAIRTNDGHQKSLPISFKKRSTSPLLRTPSGICFATSVSRRRCLLSNHANESNKPSNVGKTKRFMRTKKSRKRGYVPCFLGRKWIFDIADLWSGLGRGRQADCVTINVFTTYAIGFWFYHDDTAAASNDFRFTIVDGAINTQDVIFFLTMIRRYYGKKVLIVMDRLPAHLSASKYFECEHSDGFEFVYFPS